jgi:TPR repeat protein
METKSSVESQEEEKDLRYNEDLIAFAEAIAERVHTQAHELMDKLESIQGGAAMLQKLLEVVEEVEGQHKRIVDTLNEPSVHAALKQLCESMRDCSLFLANLAKKRFLLTSRAKVRREMLLLQQSVRNKCTQLMTAVSLVLADRPSWLGDRITQEELERLYIMGLRCYHGFDSPRDTQQASALFSQGAEHGHCPSMTLLARLYELGEGVDSDHVRARQWLEQAAHDKYPEAMNLLALRLLQDLYQQHCTTGPCHQQHSWTLRFHEFDKSLALAALERALTVRRGTVWTPRGSSCASVDTPLNVSDSQGTHAVSFLMQAAERGHLEAQANLGLVFEASGDYTEAASMYESATLAGSARAQNFFAVMLFSGKGVPKVHGHNAEVVVA